MTYLIGKVVRVDRNMCYLAISRRSNAVDIVPVMIPDILRVSAKDLIGKYVFIKGWFLSKNIEQHLVLYVSPEDISIVNPHNHNSSELQGVICKKTNCRYTPKGRQITEMIIAFNHNGESHYIPCICWESTSILASELSIGTRVNVGGRIQSRNYNKDGREMTTYELSVERLSLG